MTELLTGDIWLDESFQSKVDGYPGTKFIIDLKNPPMDPDHFQACLELCETDADEKTKNVIAFEEEQQQKLMHGVKADADDGESPDELTKLIPKAFSEGSKKQVLEELANQKTEEEPMELPGNLKVLFVDDDMILRKLFARSLRKVAPGWNIQEAASGETSLQMVAKETFDIIFMDQYMASVQKQLLGTETTRALRGRGVMSRICGLSANDVEEGFMSAGADFFMLKPFPCKPDELRKQLLHLIYSKRPNPAYEKMTSTPERSDSASQ
jgi:CheY-like chemotaxis protein